MTPNESCGTVECNADRRPPVDSRQLIRAAIVSAVLKVPDAVTAQLVVTVVTVAKGNQLSPVSAVCRSLCGAPGDAGLNRPRARSAVAQADSTRGS